MSLLIVDPSSIPGARPGEMPYSLKPQLATLTKAVPVGPEWLHEIKYDGYRMLCFLEHGKARLLTRRGLDWSYKYPEVVREIEKWSLPGAVFDGEMVVLDAGGKADFQALQSYSGREEGLNLVYFLFDLTWYSGWDLRRSPLEDRKGLLSQILPASGACNVKLSRHIRGDGQIFYREACRLGLEGIVSKRKDSFYQERRSGNWLKVKCSRRQEFVVVGYTEPGGGRPGFGALLLGYYDQGSLVYAGKVGTGFDEKMLQKGRSLLQQLEQGESPLDRCEVSLLPDRGKIHWVEPRLAVEVTFTGWTGDGLLRHPSFQGWRADKEPAEVNLE